MITQSTYRDGTAELGKEMTPGINQSFDESENSQVFFYLILNKPYVTFATQITQGACAFCKDLRDV